MWELFPLKIFERKNGGQVTFSKVGDILLKMSTYRATENYVYKTDECIGRGATGDVYKGVHKVTGEHCALKLCDSRFTQQLQREVEAMRQLQHPNITKFYQLEYDVCIQ